MPIFTQLPLSTRYMLLSALGFALMSACVKLANQQGIPVLEIVAARALISCLLSYADIRRQGISPWGNNKVLLLARGLVGSLALICVYYSLTTLPLAEATVLQYLHPIFTAIIAFLFLKEAIQRSTLACILLGIIGLICITRPVDFLQAQGSIPPLSLAAALAGALGSAIAYVIVRKLSQSESPSVIILYFPMMALPISLIALGDDFVMPNLHAAIYLLFVGIFTQVGQIGLTKAMQSESAGKATAYSYIQVVFAGLLGWLLFGELPDIWVVAGALCIISGAIINVLGKR